MNGRRSVAKSSLCVCVCARSWGGGEDIWEPGWSVDSRVGRGRPCGETAGRTDGGRVARTGQGWGARLSADQGGLVEDWRGLGGASGRHGVGGRGPSVTGLLERTVCAGNQGGSVDGRGLGMMTRGDGGWIGLMRTTPTRGRETPE